MTENEISRAIKQYLGFGIALTPQRSPHALLHEFGETRGMALQSEVLTLLNEMAGIKVDWSAHSLISGTKMAVDIIRERHPELSSEALEALGWEFSWSWR